MKIEDEKASAERADIQVIMKTSIIHGLRAKEFGTFRRILRMSTVARPFRRRRGLATG
jgi:hypothetical protein